MSLNTYLFYQYTMNGLFEITLLLQIYEGKF